jgi:serine/threonine-protein kinase
MAALAAERHLLFGLLALQNGLIDQGQLVAAFQSWTLNKARALADHLVGRGDLDGEQRGLLEALVIQHLKKHGGDAERSLAAIAVGPSTRESLARIGDPDLGGTLTHVASASTEHDDPDRTASYAVGSATSDGQRFRVLRPHARGGLGAVFVALDEELHREVALKQILDRHADDPTSRARFLLEAEITGGLEHPGIVPVYGLGTYADGRPYYAMRFVRGDSLKEAIDRFHADGALKSDPGRRSLELRKLLRRFTDLCNAIAYAHSRGVLHRDIKPGNIIVGQHGETLVVDWGLAKATGKAEPGAEEQTLVPVSTSGSAETLPGSALGTPAYMSPEQARGDLEHLGPRSDVYSLGATLYCLLTGKPPQEGDDVGEVLRRVQRGEFTSPRQHDPSIDKALEAVCLKALAVKPEDRYARCRALADEIERWMADEPIEARPDGPLERLARWSRRHRSLTWSAAAALLVLAGSSTVAAVAVNAARGREQEARQQAVANLERANRSFRMARQAVDDYLTRVSENTLLKFQPSSDLRRLRKSLLEDALKFYRQFIEHREGDADLRRELARAYARVGSITDEIGTRAGALAAHERAATIRRELARADEADVTLRVDLAESLDAIGVLRRAMGLVPEALAAMEEARALLEDMLAVDPNRAEALERLARTCSHLASLHRDREDFQRIGPFHERALGILRRLVAISPDEPRYRRELAWTTYQVGNLYSNARRKGLDPARARAYFAEAQALQRELIAAYPGEPDYPIDMAQSYVSLGDLAGLLGDRAQAIQHLREALGIQRPIVEAHPTVSLYLLDLGSTYYNLGYQSSMAGRPEDAVRWYSEAIQVAERLIQLDPENVDYRYQLGRALNNLGYKLLEWGRFAEAEAPLMRSVKIHRELMARGPDVPMNRPPLVNALLNLARVRVAQRKHAEAVEVAKEARALGQGMPGQLADLAACLATAAEGLAEGERVFELAIETLRESLAAGPLPLGLMVNAPGYEALRKRPESHALFLDRVFPDDPFAGP